MKTEALTWDAYPRWSASQPTSNSTHSHTSKFALKITTTIITGTTQPKAAATEQKRATQNRFAHSLNPSACELFLLQATTLTHDYQTRNPHSSQSFCRQSSCRQSSQSAVAFATVARLLTLLPRALWKKMTDDAPSHSLEKVN